MAKFGKDRLAWCVRRPGEGFNRPHHLPLPYNRRSSRAQCCLAHREILRTETERGAKGARRAEGISNAVAFHQDVVAVALAIRETLAAVRAGWTARG